MRKQEFLLVQIFVAALLVMIGAYVFKLGTMPPELPLFYSLIEGEDTITPSYYIFLLPIISLIIIVVNIFVYRRIFTHDLFVRKLLYYSSVGAIVISTFVFLKILFLVS